MHRFAACLLLLAAAAPAAVLNVPADHADIASALGTAGSGDEVVVAAGTYLEHDLVLPSGVILRGATGDPADVIVDGQRLGRCVYGADLDAATRIEALTLSNGLPAWGTTPHNSWGGALMVDGGALTVSNCVFSANETAVGGGAYVIGTGAPTFLDCVFDGNSGTEASGLQITGTCDPVLRRCVFRGASGCMYGGGFTWGGTGRATVEDGLFEDNVVIESGGAVEVFGAGAVLDLSGCTIQNNTGGMWGGGLYVGNNARAELTDCTITGNSASDSGGGVYMSWTTSLAANGVIIGGNTAPAGADGLVGTGVTATLTCCTVDAGAWLNNGELILDDENCGTPREPTSWGDVKAIYR